MILADKIIELRKKNGWSQEEFAEKMNVSRQAVSKWEGALSTPDLGRILQMADLFGVSTDYLLRDEMEQETPAQGGAQESPVRRVSMEEANEFLSLQAHLAKRIALGVMLCILSPVVLISCSSLGDAAVIGGVVVLLALVAAAVAIFINAGMQGEPWEFLEKEEFETEYGVIGMVRERQKNFKPQFVRNITAGVVLCILSPIPLIASALAENGILTVQMVSLLLGIVSVAVSLFIRVGMPWDAMQQLLQEGEYTKAEKRMSRVTEPIAGVYWTIVAAIYLAWSFVGGNWGTTWVVWPIAGVAFVAIMSVAEMLEKRRQG